MINYPQITVLMPAYNAALYVAEAIDSVLAQTFTDFELLIVNDGSSDNTADIINSYEDSRVRLITQENCGVAAALNNGLSAAKGQYIARFDADDICEPNRLQIQYDFIEDNPGYDIIGSAANYVDQSGAFVFTYTPPIASSDKAHSVNLAICPFIHSTTFYRKAVIMAAGNYDVNAHGFEDHLLWVKLLKNHIGYNLKQTLIKVRLNPFSVTMDEQWQHTRFLEIKKKALSTGSITNAEGNELLQIRKQQRDKKINLQAYNGLLAKKFLWDNHNPKQARKYLNEAIGANLLNFKNYQLWALSLLPGWLIARIYHLFKLHTSKN